MTYKPFNALNTKNKNIYSLGVDIWTDFDIRSLPVSKGAEPSHMAISYIPYDAPLHKEQEYAWFRGGDDNGFRDIK